MNNRTKKYIKQALALTLALIMSIQTGIPAAGAQQEASGYNMVFDGNMVVNPGFEIGKDVSGWEAKGGGYASNNKHNGVGHFYLDGGSGNYLKQEITVPYTGFYKFSVFLATGGAGAVFGVKNKNSHENIGNVVVPAKSTYTEYSFEAALNKNDTFELYVSGANGWVNGDDFSVMYNSSKFVNLIVNSRFDGEEGWELSETSVSGGKAILENAASALTQSVFIPVEGPYYAEVEFESAQNADLTFADNTIQVKDGGKKRIEVANGTVGQEVTLTVSGAAIVLSAEVKFDVSKIPNDPPAASDVSILGSPEIDKMFTAQYTFTDPDSNTEGTSLYSWYISDTENGEYSAIEGENNKNLLIKPEYLDKYIKFHITPVDQYEMEGTTVVSEVVGPVDLNLVANPGFEKNGANWSGLSISNKGAYEDLVRGIVNTGQTGYQRFKVPATGYYNFTAYVKKTGGTTDGSAGVRGTAGEVFSETPVGISGDYKQVKVDAVPLERGQEAEVFFTAADTAYDVDTVVLKRDRTMGVPVFLNILGIQFNQPALTKLIDTEKKEIHLEFIFGTDLSKMELEEFIISEGAAASVKAGDTIDLTKPYTIKLTAADQTEQEWTVTAALAEKKISLESSNTYLMDTFNWAAYKQRQFVMTGKNGLVNKDENNPQGSGTADYLPSYWAGYYDRTAFYSRDFVHQASGGQIAGLTEENYSMFKIFAENSTKSRKWYTPWAFNFDGTPHTIDYKNDTNFVREVPAQFELVEKAYNQYLWSGDKRYINNPDMFYFYTKVMTDYIGLHDDQNPNGIAEGYGGIFQGSCTYNERGEHPIEAADAIGSQYQATLAYAGILEARGDLEGAKEWNQKAQELKDYFNQEWSVNPDDPEGNYARILTKEGDRKYDFGKENSWFIPLKMVSEPGERNDKYIDYILENLGEGIGSTSEAPGNLEAYTYIPDMLFLYNRNEDAWKWMKYITSIKDLPHERPSQGTNGDYPEISFTFVSHTIEGMMGVKPNAGIGYVATTPRLPEEVKDVTANYISIGDYEVNLTHNGNQASSLTNHSEKDLTWEAGFYGDHDYIKAGNKLTRTKKKEINGEAVSYITITVKASDTVEAVVAEKPVTPGNPGNSGNSGSTEEDSTGSVTAPVETEIGKPVLKQESGNGQAVTSVVSIKAKVENNSTAVTIPDKTVEEAILIAKEQAAKQKKPDGIQIEFQLETEKQSDKNSVIFTEASLKQMIAEQVSSLSIVTREITLSADRNTLEELKATVKGSVKFTAQKESQKSAAVKKLTKDRPVYQFTVTGGEKDTKEIKDFKTGSIKIAMSYPLKKGEKPNRIYAAYIDDKGKAECMKSSVYDAKSGMLHFTTNHFSVFGIAYKEDGKELMKQIKAAPAAKTLYTLGSKKGKETNIIVSYPITMEPMAAFSGAGLEALITEVKPSFTSSNKKVAVVSKTGKVTAKSSGKTTITTTVAAKDGTKRTFKSSITVKAKEAVK